MQLDSTVVLYAWSELFLFQVLKGDSNPNNKYVLYEKAL